MSSTYVSTVWPVKTREMFFESRRSSVTRLEDRQVSKTSQISSLQLESAGRNDIFTGSAAIATVHLHARELVIESREAR